MRAKHFCYGCCKSCIVMVISIEIIACLLSLSYFVFLIGVFLFIMLSYIFAKNHEDKLPAEENFSLYKRKDNLKG